MEFIIAKSNDHGAEHGELFEDETSCSRGLCSHPSCWASHVRETRGFRRYMSVKPEIGQLVEEDELDLPTVKVLNMLDEYGESDKDLFPSKYRGLPVHQRSQAKSRDILQSKSSLVCPSPSKEGNSISDIVVGHRKPANMNPVELLCVCDDISEVSFRFFSKMRNQWADYLLVHSVLPQPNLKVQEVFDLEELSQDWQNTFLTQPMYVWVPSKKNKKKKRKKKRPSQASSSVNLMPGGGEWTVAMKDVTNDLLPRPDPRPSPNITSSKIPNQQPGYNKSPLPTGGQPYMNVGQTPKDRMRYQMIMEELKDLPRPFVIEVLEKSRHLKSKEDLLLLMEKYLETMNKSDWELSMVTSQVLQQKKINFHNLPPPSSKDQRPSSRVGTTPRVYKLDTEQTADQQTVFPAPPAPGPTPRKYQPLPSIPDEGEVMKKKKPIRVHVSTSTKESVKPFRYAKENNMAFCLERCPSGNHIAGPYKNHICPNYMLHRYLTDFGLKSPDLSTASDYCDLICSKLGYPCTKPKNTCDQVRRRYASVSTQYSDGGDDTPLPPLSPLSEKFIPDLQLISAITNLPQKTDKDKFYPFFTSPADESSILTDSSCCCPTKSLPSVPSRPASERTLAGKTPDGAASGVEPAGEGDDLVVHCDNESVNQNMNNSNFAAALEDKTRKPVTPRLQDSQRSRDMPKAPHTTPYTPTTPLQMSHQQAFDRRVPGELEQQDAGLGVIDEVRGASHPTRDSTDKSNALLSPKPDVKMLNKRISQSAQVAKLKSDVLQKRRVSSAEERSASFFPQKTSNQPVPVVPADRRVGVASRSDMMSRASHWPVIDEDELLRQQTLEAEAERLASAEEKPQTTASGKTRLPSSISNNQTTAGLESQPKEDTRNADHEEVEDGRSPAPPPPSPDPANLAKYQRVIVQVPTSGQHIDNSGMYSADLEDEVPNTESERIVQEDITEPSVVEPALVSDMKENPSQPENTPTPVEETGKTADTTGSEPVNDLVAGDEKESPPAENSATKQAVSTDLKPEHTDQFQPPTESSAANGVDKELNGQDNTLYGTALASDGQDPLGVVLDDDADSEMERELTLSALPPSVLTSPDIKTPANQSSLVNNSRNDMDVPPQETPQPVTLPTVNEVMKPDDEGGLSGQI